MERSALYRRALAPITIFVGVMGVLAATAGWVLKIEAARAFAMYWMAVSVATLAGALLLVRRQAVKQGENFWSPPTRRVVQAMFPPLFVGLFFGVLLSFTDFGSMVFLVIIWPLLYGLALNAAGFFMPRGIRLFGWGFIIASLLLSGLLAGIPDSNATFHEYDQALFPHAVMGVLFGGSHLAYGVYLYFTEARKNET
jgi:hypothetical protein